MNMESIVDWLRAVGVPAEVVSVGAEADNAWCLLRDDGGLEDTQPGWEVFWREQGNRYDWARFSSEHVACHYLFGRLTWSQVARGAVGVLPTQAQAGAGQSGVAQPGAAQPGAGQPGAGQAGAGQSDVARQGEVQASPSHAGVVDDADPASAEVTQPRTIAPAAGQGNAGQGNAGQGNAGQAAPPRQSPAG